MHKRTTLKTFARAKELHRNMSPAEAELWKHLRAHRMGDVHFRNQHAIGNYIVDFSPEGDDVRPSQEIDHRAGWHSLRSQHLEQREYDEERTKYLEARGYRVLRFWNNDVMKNMDHILQVIWNALKDGEKKE
ncbi:MAG TPA: DUF559 domain-containing protein [Anaerolineales bacterium]|nr:DUF559 domain-containing protein [Anaerolineales bacterium]